MIQTQYVKFMFKVKCYLKENWGSPFIVAFMILLLSAAVSLAVGSYLADAIAVYAFYALVAGVILQLVCFLKYGKKTDGAEVVL